MNIELYHNIHNDLKVKGFLDYHYCSELEKVVQYNVYDVIENNYIDNINYICIYAHGSRVFGNPRKNSDIDFVLFYKGNIKEDILFNILADEPIYIEHIKCDFNPIEIDDESDIEYYILKHDIEYHKNPILEGKRNLAMALDDFNDDLIGQLTETIKDTNYTKAYLDLLKITVDLGLPSGTLWCKYNLGVDENKLTYNPDSWYGDYYQWGETKPERLYDWQSYEHANGDWNMLNKYCNDAYYWELDTPIDNLTRLQDEDDAAYQNMHCHNFKFHIPTREQFKELLKYTDLMWTKDYGGVPGLNGKVLISKINKQKIFFPVAGFISDGEKGCEGSFGYYWSSDLSRDEGNNCACYFNVYNYDVDLPEDGSRENGFVIRPVCNI